MSGGCPISTFGKLFLAPFCPMVKTIFKAVFRIKAYGLENIPDQACIVASNHRSHLDPPVLNAVFKEPLRFMAKEELFHVPVLGWFLPHMGAIPVRRGSGDTQALEIALELLHKGCKVGIFPEGTRAAPGEFLKPKLGVGLLAIKSGKPLLPVYIDGTDKVMPKGKKFPKPGHTIKVTIGKPFYLHRLEDNPKGYREAANKIMEKIKELAHGS